VFRQKKYYCKNEKNLY